MNRVFKPFFTPYCVLLSEERKKLCVLRRVAYRSALYFALPGRSDIFIPAGNNSRYKKKRGDAAAFQKGG